MPEDPNKDLALRRDDPRNFLEQRLSYENVPEGQRNDFFSNQDMTNILNNLNDPNANPNIGHSVDTVISDIETEKSDGHDFTLTFENQDNYTFEMTRVAPRPEPSPDDDDPHLSLRLRQDAQALKFMSDKQYRENLDTMNDVSMRNMLETGMDKLEHNSPYAPGGPLADAPNAEQRLQIEQDSLQQSMEHYRPEYEDANMKPNVLHNGDNLLTLDFEGWRKFDASGDHQFHRQDGEFSALSYTDRMTPQFKNREHDSDTPEEENPSYHGHKPHTSSLPRPSPDKTSDPKDPYK